MVRHGRAKKRRAGRIGRTKLKNKNFRRWDPNPKITDSTIRKHWDPSKSPSANLASMGLTANANNLASAKTGFSHKGMAGEGMGAATVEPRTAPKVDVVELYDIPKSDDLSAKNQQNRVTLSLSDQKYIAKCMSKHGDNYTAMFRDIKVNRMQHTEHKLRKLGSRFLLLSEKQRAVSLPDKVKQSAPEST